MRPWFLFLLFTFVLLTSCSSKNTEKEDEGPAPGTLAVVLVQGEPPTLKVRYMDRETPVPLKEQLPFRLRNDQLSLQVLYSVSENMILDLRFELETKQPLKMKFIGFPDAAIMKDGTNVGSSADILPGKHYFRLTHILRSSPP
jgi:hypothetical protein